jgi:hypothetical protein
MVAGPEASGPPPGPDPESHRRDALTGRLFQASLGAFELLTVYLGERLGWYAALRAGGRRRRRS